jgi:hypothetical protein
MGLSWPLHPHRKSPVHIEEEDRWAPEPNYMLQKRELALLPLPGIKPTILGNSACSLVTTTTKLSWKIQIIVF